MQWLNEPASWQRSGGVLTVSVDPGTDFWRQTGYGYIRDSGHVYGEVIAGDLDVSVRIRGTLDSQYDQAGVMLRADQETWLKTGLEVFEGEPRLSTVLTLGRSSWTVTGLPGDAEEIVLRVARRDDAVEVRYATGSEEPDQLAALVFLPPGCEVLAGVMCAAPEGPGFIVSFHDLVITPRGWAAPPDSAGDADGDADLWPQAGPEPWAGSADPAGDEASRRWLPADAAGADWPGPATGQGWSAGEAGGGWPAQDDSEDAVVAAGAGWQAAAATEQRWPAGADSDTDPRWIAPAGAEEPAQAATGAGWLGPAVEPEEGPAGQPEEGPAWEPDETHGQRVREQDTSEQPAGQGTAPAGQDSAADTDASSQDSAAEADASGQGRTADADASSQDSAANTDASGQDRTVDADASSQDTTADANANDQNRTADADANSPDNAADADWMKLATSDQARQWIAALASDLSTDWPGPPVPSEPPPEPPHADTAATDGAAVPPATEPADSKPADSEPADSGPADSKPAESAKPGVGKAAAEGSAAAEPARPAEGTPSGPENAGPDGDKPGQAGHSSDEQPQAKDLPDKATAAAPERDEPGPAEPGQPVPEPRPAAKPGRAPAQPGPAGSRSAQPGPAEPGTAEPGRAAAAATQPDVSGGSERLNGKTPLPDDATDPNLPLIAAPDTGDLPEAPTGEPDTTAKAGAQQASSEPMDPADEWISLLTTDPDE